MRDVTLVILNSLKIKCHIRMPLKCYIWSPQTLSMYVHQTSKSTGLPSRLLFFLTQSTNLLGGRTFLLVLRK